MSLTAGNCPIRTVQADIRGIRIISACIRTGFAREGHVGGASPPTPATVTGFPVDRVMETPIHVILLTQRRGSFDSMHGTM